MSTSVISACLANVNLFFLLVLTFVSPFSYVVCSCFQNVHYGRLQLSIPTERFDAWGRVHFCQQHLCYSCSTVILE
jgi:hypothetical protein